MNWFRQFYPQLNACFLLGCFFFIHGQLNAYSTEDACLEAESSYSSEKTDFFGVTITGMNEMTASSTTASIVSSTNVSCNGGSDGSITATGVGGTTPYTYAWSNGGTNPTINNLFAGTYTVTVTDALGCVATNTPSRTITEPTAVVASAVVDNNVSCNGANDGGATASATGGTTPYTYAWSKGGTTRPRSGYPDGTCA